MIDLERWFGAPVAQVQTYNGRYLWMAFHGTLPPRMPPGPCKCTRALDGYLLTGRRGWVLRFCEDHQEDPTANLAPPVTAAKRADADRVERLLREGL